MKLTKNIITSLLAAAAGLASPVAEACTNILVTPGASRNGSSMVSYSADSHTLYGALYYRPEAFYPAGAIMNICEWDTGRYLGDISQAEHTYAVVGNMNEHQLLIGESTWGGLKELRDSTGIIDYGSLIYIALQRAKTAREAIEIMTGLVAEYGYASSGESFSIADPKEVWILELIGKGTKIEKGRNVNKGAVWVAIRLPDGAISGHANQARITKIAFGDPENCLYSPDVVQFARKQGLYSGSDEDFSFSDTYNPLDFSGMRGCEARVWSVFRKVADGMDKYTDYAMGHNKNNRMPLWVTPKEKLTLKEVADFMRDHYEGTPMDMTCDLGAGSHKLPYRWRPMEFEHEGEKYVNERAIATQQTGWWYVGECRASLPDPIGGVLWFGTDDAATSPLTPIYCGTKLIPECLRVGNGDMATYSPTSMFWITNRVTNFAYLRYDVVSADVRRAMDRFENACIAEQPAIDAEAARLYKEDPKLAGRYLTEYSVNTAQRLFDTWKKLDEYLLVKFIDGNIKKESSEGFFIDNGNNAGIPVSPLQPGYSEQWKRMVAEDAGETLKVMPVE